MASRRKTSLRTKSGGVKAVARKKYGSSKASKNRTGSFPVFDAKSANSALRLRGHARNRKEIISRVARFASKTKNKALAAKAARARKADKK